MLENSYSGVPAEAVAAAIINYASFHSLICLVNRKAKSFKQTVLLSEQ